MNGGWEREKRVAATVCAALCATVPTLRRDGMSAADAERTTTRSRQGVGIGTVPAHVLEALAEGFKRAVEKGETVALSRLVVVLR